jgi:hypothetical protein
LGFHPVAVMVEENGNTFDWLVSYLLFSWTKTDMILKPSSDHGRKLTSPFRRHELRS